MFINFNHLKTLCGALFQKMKDFRGNWNQNDSTADDYIKNRPFYSERKPSVVLNISLDFVSATSINWSQSKVGYLIEDVASYAFEVGQECVVVFDGVEYITTAIMENEYNNIIVGNGAFVGDSNADNGLPFVIGNYSLGETHTYIVVGDMAQHTIGITVTQEIVHKLDPKYLPDNIGMSDDNTSSKTEPLIIRFDSDHNALGSRGYMLYYSETYTYDMLRSAVEHGNVSFAFSDNVMIIPIETSVYNDTSLYADLTLLIGGEFYISSLWLNANEQYAVVNNLFKIATTRL